jgi:hypothetical protein
MGQFEHVLEILLLEADPFVSIDPNGTGKITEAQVGRSATLDPRPFPSGVSLAAPGTCLGTRSTHTGPFRPASLSPRRHSSRALHWTLRAQLDAWITTKLAQLEGMGQRELLQQVGVTCRARWRV